ncbi:alpha/beta hydrolase-fold protein [Nocardia stercoris]|uniref:LysM peptidoglycan-binding domain-containing protein n=1 Tax=Nocardia stercoris TaxID=2483361 RepID=A0A3M2LHY4_9NOCA|nr:alpha/beta hydrolase-fold protein [Nocardia stercoris]RMI34378.1 LysM peptidoglycan-binding domain-containing protein [Nocardia stercoris]
MVRTTVLEAGDTLSGVAEQAYGDADRYPLIATANGIPDPDVVPAGLALILPDYTEVTAAPGDTLAALADRHYGDPAAAWVLARASGLAGPGDPVPDIAPGTTVVVADLTRYTVGADETLADIAARWYGDSGWAATLAAANGLPDETVTAGQVLLLFSGRSDGNGLTIVDRNENDSRLWYYRFATAAVGWNPGVNVLLPDDYHTSGHTYPVLYLFHGGGTDQDFRTFDQLGIRDLTAGAPIIVVMPDGGHAGWYSNPVSSFVGPRNWETFHIDQLIGWIDGNFRTWNDGGGRAAGGFSMGGFGALKYTTEYPWLFASVSAHSGPPSLRRNNPPPTVVDWANLSAAVLDLAGGTIYGVPWNQARVSADNPVEHIENFRDHRIFLVAGTSPDPINWFDQMNETHVLAGQREFRADLAAAGIPCEWHEVPGGHYFRPEMFRLDLPGILARLRPAG